MISTFVLLTVVGGVCRLGLNWVLRRKLGVAFGLPPILALAVVILTSPARYHHSDFHQSASWAWSWAAAA